MKLHSAATTFKTTYQNIDSQIADIYVSVLKHGMKARTERKDGFIDVYLLYPESTWVGVYEKRLEKK